MTLRDILILIGENNLVDVTINYKNELLSLGFTKQEMDEFIVDKYEECVKGE